MRLFLLLAVLLLPVPAFAANWELIKQWGTVGIHIDRDSDILLSGGHHRVWTKRTGIIGGGEKRSLIEFSCTGQFRNLEVVLVSGDKDTKMTDEWQYIRPDSDQELYEKAVCKK